MPGEPARNCFVVRGGLFAVPEDVLITVLDSVEDGYGPVASVFVGSVESGEDLPAAVRRVCQEGYIKNGKVRLSTVGALVDAGFRVEQDVTDGQPDSHHNVVFPDPPDLGQARLFIQCFDAPIPNPAKE